MSAPTNFQVTGCNSVCKIHCFHFFLQKGLCYQIWPCCKIGQGQPRFIIWTNYDGLESPMLHTKFRANRSTRFQRFFKCFYHIWAWQPSWSCDSDAANKLSFPLSKEAPHKIWLWSAPAVSEKKMFKHCGRTDNDDGQTTDHGYTISSPMSLRLRVS